MPEGHTIHRLAARMNSVFGGQLLEVSSPQGRFSRGALLLNGRRLVFAQAFGKQLHMHFAAPENHDDVLVMRSHLGLYGKWTFAGDEQFESLATADNPRRRADRVAADDGHGRARDEHGWVVPEAARGAIRVRLRGKHGWADLRGPTECRVETVSEAAAALKRLGPDPLDPDETGGLFVARAGRSARPIAALLMEQQVIAGVGNIYRAESLFRQKVDPFLPGSQAGEEVLHGLWTENRELLKIGVRLGRIVTTDQADRPRIPDERAWPEHANYVYKRAGKPCRHCQTPVEVTEMVGRTLYWCPTCQAPGT